jgi:hypothetical protein
MEHRDQREKSSPAGIIEWWNNGIMIRRILVILGFFIRRFPTTQFPIMNEPVIK